MRDLEYIRDQGGVNVDLHQNHLRLVSGLLEVLQEVEAILASRLHIFSESEVNVLER